MSMHFSYRPLCDLTFKVGSGSTPRGGKNAYKESGISLIRSLNIYDYQFKRNNLAFIDENQAIKLKNVIVEKNDILLNITGASVCRCSIVPNNVLPARVNQHVAIIRTDPKILNPKFALYAINSFSLKQGLFNLAMTGATREALTKNDILGYKLPAPEIGTQKKIAAILSSYDDLIENNKRRIALLENMAEEIYREWFVRFRFPGNQTSEFEKGIPKEWEINTLGDIIELAYGKALKADERIEGEYPVYGSSGIVGYHNKAFVLDGGIIVGRKGNVGSVHWANKGFFPIDTVYYVKSSLPSCFIFYVLKSMNFINNDSAVPGLNRNQAYSNKLLLPSLDLINIFSEFVQPIFEQIEILTCSNELLERTKNELLTRLISGKLSVEDLNIQFPPSMQDTPPSQLTAP